MIPGSSAESESTQELRRILAVLRDTIKGMAEENEMLTKTINYYATENWRTLSLLDRGFKARRVYRQVAGRRFNGIVK